jgi:hypothetical protein
MELSGRPDPGLLELIANGHKLPWTDISEGDRAWLLPPSVTEGQTEITIEIKASPLFSPAEFGNTNDDRWLGVAVRSIGLFRESVTLRSRENYRIGSGPGDLGALESGWHGLESWGCWSDGEEASLYLAYTAKLTGDYALELDLTPPLLGGMVILTVNDVRLAPTLVAKGWNAWMLPAHCMAAGTGLSVRIAVGHAVRPSEFEESEDDRLLGIGISGFRIRPAHEVEQD